MATSSGLFVDWNEPSVISFSIAATCTPSPTCSGFVPPLVAVAPEDPRSTCVSESANVTWFALNPTVFTFARSLAVLLSIVWFASRPLMAAYIPPIMIASLPFAASSARSGRGCYMFASASEPNAWGVAIASWCASCDHGAVDVGEHVLAHVFRSDRRNDGAVVDGH